MPVRTASDQPAVAAGEQRVGPRWTARKKPVARATPATAGDDGRQPGRKAREPAQPHGRGGALGRFHSRPSHSRQCPCTRWPRCHAITAACPPQASPRAGAMQPCTTGAHLNSRPQKAPRAAVCSSCPNATRPSRIDLLCAERVTPCSLQAPLLLPCVCVAFPLSGGRASRLPLPRRALVPAERRSPSSSRTGTFSCIALSYFEPGLSPTTTNDVFLETEPVTFAPRLCRASFAPSRVWRSSVPVTTTVSPSSGRGPSSSPGPRPPCGRPRPATCAGSPGATPRRTTA